MSLIILSQICLIFGSFLVLAIAESQTALLGNSVNVAGKNRFLTSQFLDEVKDWAYVKNPDSSPDNAFRDLEENIYLLKNGGVSGNIEITELDVEFEDDWIKISENLTILKTKFIEFKLKNTSDLKYSDLIEDRKSTRLNSSHSQQSRMPSSA